MFGRKQSRDTSKYYHFHEDYGRNTNDYRHLKVQIQEAINSGQLSHLVKGIKKEKAKSTDTHRGEGKKDKSITPVQSDSPHNMLLGRKAMQKMGIVVLTIHGAIKVYTKKGVGTVLLVGEAREETKKARRTLTISKERIPNEHFKKELRNLLRANANIFAWTHADMTGISRTIMVDRKPFNTEHKLNEYSHIKPIKQNKRSLGLDRNTAACKEAEELMKEGILLKVKHQTWVSNPVMIDWKIESIAGFRLKCFLNAYKGYCQIQMAGGVEDKTAFFVGEGVFCYGKMPFGLKKTRATYQRLVDKVFSKQIRRNLEAYVDDMVIKSTSKERMLSDIQETFERFWSINMKLNPKKCSFGVEEGPFLGHLITKQGIKANPSKIKAVTKKIPSFLQGKRCKGKKKIHWTDKADKAFKEMKKFVQVLPTLIAPRARETLTMYLAVSKESINAALFAKRSEGKIPIYFVIRVLQGAELNYLALEKLILALVHAARRLQKYFQAHMILVLTGTPIKQALTGPEKAGRVAKWTIELGEHDIIFLKRDERETPADFLPEIPFDDSEKKVKEKEVSYPSNKWKLYIDGASNSDGAGAGLMLIDPAGKEYTYALRFEFETTNNEAEYEALLAGLRIA
ncbi:reverse transcriptase domain-containing protein [Tanacetum coccineum]